MSETDPVSGLTARELEAIRGAAVWYAKYRSGAIAGQADERSASAVAEREEYLNLVSGLGKLGVRIRVPDTLLEQIAA